ncbi:50S ribosomal protein L7/L12-like [Phoenix dactylifera]|uniref:50S ribosomal protein L7/L12-like n=1 Tax=Phoenix dactylifera TaxID=42345 RepID=A0A8B7BLA1_PHODC|nr:50S ribosomal protein L7/L12-like [Phoenix dactylifera]
MPLLSTKISPRPLLRLLLPSATRPLSSAAAPAGGGASAEARTQKLERIADELLSLTKAERDDYSILFRLKLGLHQWIPAGGVPAPGVGDGLAAEAANPAEEKEKTAFDIKLEKFDTAAKIKVIKEVRTFTDLGLKEAKELVEKTPVVLKKGVTKEEAEAIAAKLKQVGATVVLE